MSRTPASVRAALAVARGLGLRVENHRVLRDSNRVVILLEPADIVARVHSDSRAEEMRTELEVVNQLSVLGAPVGLPADDGVHVREGLAVTLWRYYPQPAGHVHNPQAYVAALLGLHWALRELPVGRWPSISTISEDALAALDRGPASISEPDRLFLRQVIASLATVVAAHPAPRQLLHTQPHDKNVLYTPDGLVLIDFEGHECPRLGPIEFDLAHVPEEVADAYPGLDRELLHTCQLLVRAHVATWCFELWDHSEEMRWVATTCMRSLRSELPHGSGLDKASF